jgi:hypothetical protein
MKKAKWRWDVFGQALVLTVVLTLVCSEAHASLGGIGLGGGGGLGGGALSSLINMIKQNIAAVASLGILGIGLALAFAKAAWMELVGQIAFVVALGIFVMWAASNTGSFFGTGALL